MAISDPNDISQLLFEYDSKKIPGVADTDPVSTWPDDSGFGRDAIAQSGAETPVFQADNLGFNGNPSVDFDGVDDWLLVENFSLAELMAGFGTQSLTIFLIRLHDDVDTGYNILGEDPQAGTAADVEQSVWWNFRGDFTSPDDVFQIRAGGGGNFQSDASGLTAGEAFHAAVRVDDDANEVEFFLNGISIGLRTGLAESAWTAGANIDMGVAARNRDTGPVLHLAGSMGVLFAYSQALTDAVMQDVFDYLDNWLLAPESTPPDMPSIFVGTRTETELELTSSAYQHTENLAHTASEWQIDEFGGDFSAPVYDSGRTTTDLEAHNVPVSGNLASDTMYQARVRHEDENGNLSDWSNPSIGFTLSSLLSLSVDTLALDALEFQFSEPPLRLSLISAEDIDPRFLVFESDCDVGAATAYSEDDGAVTSFTECDDA